MVLANTKAAVVILLFQGAMPGLPVKSVCWLAGFTNTEQMRVTFLQQVGMTPGQYRLGHRPNRARTS